MNSKDRKDYDDYEWLRCPVPKSRQPQEKKTIKDIYSLMKKCWSIHPEKRPTFEEISEELDQVSRERYNKKT